MRRAQEAAAGAPLLRLEDLPLSGAHALRLFRYALGNAAGNYQYPVDVAVQQIQRPHGQASERHRHVDPADDRVAMRDDEAGAEVLKAAERPNFHDVPEAAVRDASDRPERFRGRRHHLAVAEASGV
jgi:hypothetical protein